jgi:hypothetical protein
MADEIDGPSVSLNRRPARERGLEAARLSVLGRGGAYGAPAAFFARVAQRWSLRFGVAITARQVALCLVDLKIERADAGHKGDTAVDIAGYAACLYEIDEGQP